MNREQLSQELMRVARLLRQPATLQTQRQLLASAYGQLAAFYRGTGAWPRPVEETGDVRVSLLRGLGAMVEVAGREVPGAFAIDVTTPTDVLAPVPVWFEAMPQAAVASDRWWREWFCAWEITGVDVPVTTKGTQPGLSMRDQIGPLVGVVALTGGTLRATLTATRLAPDGFVEWCKVDATVTVMATPDGPVVTYTLDQFGGDVAAMLQTVAGSVHNGVDRVLFPDGATIDLPYRAGTRLTAQRFSLKRRLIFETDGDNPALIRYGDNGVGSDGTINAEFLNLQLDDVQGCVLRNLRLDGGYDAINGATPSRTTALGGWAGSTSQTDNFILFDNCDLRGFYNAFNNQSNGQRIAEAYVNTSIRQWQNFASFSTKDIIGTLIAGCEFVWDGEPPIGEHVTDLADRYKPRDNAPIWPVTHSARRASMTVREAHFASVFGPGGGWSDAGGANRVILAPTANQLKNTAMQAAFRGYQRPADDQDTGRVCAQICEYIGGQEVLQLNGQTPAAPQVTAGYGVFYGCTLTGTGDTAQFVSSDYPFVDFFACYFVTDANAEPVYSQRGWSGRAIVPKHGGKLTGNMMMAGCTVDVHGGAVVLYDDPLDRQPNIGLSPVGVAVIDDEADLAQYQVDDNGYLAPIAGTLAAVGVGEHPSLVIWRDGSPRGENAASGSEYPVESV